MTQPEHEKLLQMICKTKGLYRIDVKDRLLIVVALMFLDGLLSLRVANSIGRMYQRYRNQNSRLIFLHPIFLRQFNKV